MTLQHLFDPVALCIVLGGTILAGFARSGLSDYHVTATHLVALLRPRFDATKARAHLAPRVARMQRDGVIRSDAPDLADLELKDATKALIRHRSTDAMMAEHERHVASRQKTRERAMRTLDSVAELGPVFGLAGTLFALSQLPRDFDALPGLTTSVSTAVVSTLYGLMLAHIVFYPLARAIERRGEREEEAREMLVRWLVAQLKQACPVTRPVERPASASERKRAA
ncbi:MotA/TolQ/ExbB proton channel family protein [Altererythrobacter lutimaris]|uniref:MotA/TolQ/ExbB proton channel family protein n=1 Tax=Altererythrobacter lutimaris TaxID=2743979 RepID=A0A850H693_9SPHN|nr:MotA/TolQ/ExbB proton channel family protein [Altererythrobacter lutimaris]